VIKQPNHIQRLFKAAIGTSPVIAALLVMPIYLLTGENIIRIEYLLPLACVVIFIVWCTHIVFIRSFSALKKWQRFAIVTSFFMVLSTIILNVLHPQLPFAFWKLHLIRMVNVVSINSIIFIISNYILLNQTKKQLDIENQELKFANLEARYQTLKNQVNPHFLFNAIGTAKSLIRKNPSIADEYLVKLSDFLRLGFDNKSDTISVQEELNLCKDYIALQQMRFGDALQFKTNIETKYLGYELPYFALLTLVENAVKHNSMTEKERLTISVRNDNSALIIENNLQKKFLLETSSKTGLINLTERYRLLFDEDVAIEESVNNFIVTIKMVRQ
jgi:two-component system, LytTR family, sensor kinase